LPNKSVELLLLFFETRVYYRNLELEQATERQRAKTQRKRIKGS